MPGDYPPRDAGSSRFRRPGDNRFGQSQPGASRRQAPQPPQSPPPAGRPGASGAYRRPGYPPDRSSAANVYRPYTSAGPAAGPRIQPGASGQWSADPFGASAPGVLTSTHLEAIHRRRLGFALFHDGNVGHLWRGEVASLLGEGMLSVGVIIWLVYLTASPYAVLSAVLALGLPWLLVGPLGATFENIREPGRLLRWTGHARVIAALGIVGMHFLTIYPLLYLFLFVIGLGGRLRQSLRVAATRSCLAPGELELMTNDLYVGASVAAVTGPLVGSLLFLLLGDRIILVGLGAALLFLLAGNSDGFLDALPEKQRGFLLATAAGVAPDEATRDDLLRAARGTDGASEEGDAPADDDAEDEDNDPAAQPLSPEQQELALPEWYQQGPQTPLKAMSDIRAGLALAGGRASSATAMLALLALALVGGGLTTLEVFYLGDRLALPPLYLGVLAGLEGGGLALGALLASLPQPSKLGPRLTLVGLAVTGVALAILGAAPIAALAFLAAVGMGVANALAVTGARQTLRSGRDGAERRAISAAEAFITALASLLGAIVFTFGYAGSSRIHFGAHALTGLPIGPLFTLAGLGLALGTPLLLLFPGLREKRPSKEKKEKPAAHETYLGAAAMANPSASVVGALWGDADDDEQGAGPASRHSRAYPAADDYDDDDMGDEYDQRGYTGEYDARYDEDDDWDDEPPARGAPRRPAGRPPQPRDRRDRRDRW